jgi:hypothetical protein
MAISSYRMVLHTNSDWTEGIELPSFNVDNTLNELNRKYGILENREKIVYNKFGASDCAGFIQEIRKFFQEEDKIFYRFFSHDNIRAALSRNYGLRRGGKK